MTSGPMNLRDSLLSVAGAALLRLVACHRKNGAVNYQVNLIDGSVRNSSYNMVRMAGVAYSLCWGAEVFRDHEIAAPILAGAERAIAFLTQACNLHDGFYVSEYSFEHGPTEKGKLGATSLFALGLTYARPTNQNRSTLAALVETMRAAQLHSGAFRGMLTEEGLGSQRYASGEAILALLRSAEVDGSNSVPREVERAFPFYRRYFEFDPHPGFLLWHIDAWTRAHRLEQDKTLAMEYGAFAELLAEELLLRQVPPSAEALGTAGGISFAGDPGVSTSLYTEALSRVADMLLLQGRNKEARTYANAAIHGFCFLRSLQVSEADAGHLHHANHVIGGFRSSPKSSLLRMDNDQHAITCCLALLEGSALKIVKNGAHRSENLMMRSPSE